jgi:hypothetical protein
MKALQVKISNKMEVLWNLCVRGNNISSAKGNLKYTPARRNGMKISKRSVF